MRARRLRVEERRLERAHRRRQKAKERQSGVVRVSRGPVVEIREREWTPGHGYGPWRTFDAWPEDDQ